MVGALPDVRLRIGLLGCKTQRFVGSAASQRRHGAGTAGFLPARIGDAVIRTGCNRSPRTTAAPHDAARSAERLLKPAELCSSRTARTVRSGMTSTGAMCTASQIFFVAKYFE